MVLLVPDDLIDAVLADFRVEQLPRVYGDPLETGRYADFTDSDDLAPGELLVLWYSGQSGSCPSYLQELRVTGNVDIRQGPDWGSTPCNDDYNAYRQLVVVSEDALPEIGEVPLTLGGDESNGAGDLVLDVYPAAPTPPRG